MIRALSLAAAVAAGLSAPAFAADEAAAPATESYDVTGYTAQLSQAAEANQVRQLLQAQGYTSVSAVDRDPSGYWVASAVKNGKSTAVSVVLPHKGSETISN